MSAGVLTVLSGVGISLIGLLFVVVENHRYKPRHVAPPDKPTPRDILVHESVANTVSTVPTPQLPADGTIPEAAVLAAEIQRQQQNPKPNLNDLAHLKIQVDTYIDYVDPAEYVNEADDWLDPLRTGGTRAERRLMNEFRARGMLQRRRAPRRATRRIKRNKRLEAMHEHD